MLTRRPRAIAFDCYGTLLNVSDEDFIRACGEILRRHEVDQDSRAFWETWLAASRALAREQGRDPDEPVSGEEPEFHAFRVRWPQTFLRAFNEAGIDADAVVAYEAFHHTLCAGVAYPDTLPALERLRPHFRVAVVSNADDDHLHQALAENRLTEGAFEFILSSETARSYKPRGPIFRQAAERFGLDPADVLYVGDSPVADVLGARSAGMPVAWLNRLKITRPERVPEPEIEVGNLAELADVLLAAPAG